MIPIQINPVGFAGVRHIDSVDAMDQFDYVGRNMGGFSDIGAPVAQTPEQAAAQLAYTLFGQALSNLTAEQKATIAKVQADIDRAQSVVGGTRPVATVPRAGSSPFAPRTAPSGSGRGDSTVPLLLVIAGAVAGITYLFVNRGRG